MAFVLVNISRARKRSLKDKKLPLHVLSEDRKYYQNENKIYVTRPNVIENHTPNLGNLIG